jgi:demethylmenaquinone methyltransferase/2-methoxy-6-polyprenyl-1,4-benzoquinol methylase
MGNQVLSFGMHNLWKRRLVDAIAGETTPPVLLDLCAGTGDISLDMAHRYPELKEAILLDFCPEMLAHARVKAKKLSEGPRLRYITADAQEIPLPRDSVDAITIAYGVRNIADRSACFRDALRVLRPGGTLGILELTKPKQRLLRGGHSIYLRRILPIMGKLVAKNRDAYEYLCQSVHNFVDPAEVESELAKVGFLPATSSRLCGGIATVTTARKSDATNSQRQNYGKTLPSVPS